MAAPLPGRVKNLSQRSNPLDRLWSVCHFCRTESADCVLRLADGQVVYACFECLPSDAERVSLELLYIHNYCRKVMDKQSAQRAGGVNDSGLVETTRSVETDAQP